MSDSAFKTAKYPAYTTAELEISIANGRDEFGFMRAEIDRRAKRDAGDVSVMTDGERLRYARANPSFDARKL